VTRPVTSLYAESSAVLPWLFGEPAGEGVRTLLSAAELVVASDLTLVECHRTIHRAAAAGRIREAQAADRKSRLTIAAASWHILRLDPAVIERACRPFPGEPIRTLDALHVASALMARAAVPDLALLSLDERVRATGRGLGFAVLPA
jgi:predicted nucleic acid-binding protein